MLRTMDPIQDLKITILDLKRELARARDDNQMLKVKIRKLQGECSKKDRQIETLLDPRKSSFVKKVMSERGATMVINLRDRNDKLEKMLIERDNLIKRLQFDLQTKKLYTVKSLDKKKQSSSSSKCTVTIPYYEKDRGCGPGKDGDSSSTEHSYKSVSMYNINHAAERHSYQTLVSESSPRPSFTRRSLSADRTQFDRICAIPPVTCINPINSDIKAQYEGLSRDHLLSIIGSLKTSQQKFSPRIRKGGSPASDLERNELLCDTPHEEIQQLQNYFMDMLTEVDQLKVTISNLKNEQDKTKTVLKQKDNNLLKLAKEIKGLKRPKSEVKNNALRPRYSSSGNMHANKKQASNSEKVPTKNITTNDNPNDTREVVNACTYTEIEPEQEETNFKIIHTRTMSIQTLDALANYSMLEKTTDDETYLNTNGTSSKTQSLKNEDETRRQKFSTLLQQMQQSICERLTPYDEDKELEIEYI